MGKKVQEQYVVKEIVDRRDEKLPNGKSKTLYKVIWLGYPQSQATWQNSSKLMRHPELRKDILTFNEKRKLIIKEAKNNVKPKNNNTKKANSLSISLDQPEPSIKPQTTTKKPSEPLTAVKLTRSEVTTPNKVNSKQTKSKSDHVVGQILSKIRENDNLINSKGTTSRKNDPIIVEQTDKKIMNKVKEKLSSIKESKQQKKRTKKAETIGQKNLSLDNIFAEPKIKLADVIPETRQLEPIIQEKKHSNLKNSICSTGKPINSALEKTFLQKSQENIHPAEERGNSIIEKIKLQLVEDTNIKEVPSRNKPNESTQNSTKDDEFEIKGMILCKNEYYYLVEENGKSQIMSRAEILNSHPYELIVFYEKRINIKPAEINMMVL